jgi:hypothetical protein
VLMLLLRVTIGWPWMSSSNRVPDKGGGADENRSLPSLPFSRYCCCCSSGWCCCFSGWRRLRYP